MILFKQGPFDGMFAKARRLRVYKDVVNKRGYPLSMWHGDLRGVCERGSEAVECSVVDYDADGSPARIQLVGTRNVWWPADKCCRSPYPALGRSGATSPLPDRA